MAALPIEFNAAHAPLSFASLLRDAWHSLYPNGEMPRYQVLRCHLEADYWSIMPMFFWKPRSLSEDVPTDSMADMVLLQIAQFNSQPWQESWVFVIKSW
jgi:hypothetical protein